jgi:hypothetical protein
VGADQDRAGPAPGRFPLTMAWQLIYTSAPRGLMAGRSGFCTVARHAEIRDRLVTEAERLSGYDRSVPQIFSHRILEVTGARYHLLTRIGDAGLDHTGRPTHLAHHLICEESEISHAASPARIMRRFPWRASWNEAPRFFTSNERVNLAAWNTGTSSTGEPLLSLYEESLRQLDPTGAAPHRLWQIRFTTHLQASDRPADFDWRGDQITLPGTAPAPSRPAAFAAPQQSPSSPVVYTDEPDPIRDAADWVEQARREHHTKVIVYSLVIGLSVLLLALVLMLVL